VVARGANQRRSLVRTAIVLGSTGLVGSELVKILTATDFYGSVLLLNRRASGYAHPKLSETIIDFDAPVLDGIHGEDLYCAIGTTLRKAGSKAAQFTIDCEYPTKIARMLRAQGTRQMILVSSVGADPQAATFYLRTKGQLETNLMGMAFESTVILRPSFLVGQRAEFRAGEAVAIAAMKLLSPLMLGAFRKYRGIEANKVAARMVAEANAGVAGVRIIESYRIDNAE
jgi:uncharacterized protein YbjT (DUF2867 family)